MTLNGGSGASGSRGAGRERDRRRGSTPWGPAPPLHRRSMPVDERDLQAALAPGSLATTAAGTRTQGQRLDWPEGSSDSLSSGGSGSEEGVYKVLLLGAPGVGKSALARIFGGIEDGPEAEAAGHTYDRSITVDGEEASLLVYDIWEQDGGCWLPGHCMAMGDAYVIVYSITDKGSFEKASELRVQLRRARQTDDVPIILVGNKSDLVRSREVLSCRKAFTTEAQPAESLHTEVPENYGGNFPFYILKLPLPLGRDEGHIVLSGDSNTADQNTFAVDTDSGFLVVTRTLDREEKAEYQLQVTLESEDGRVLWGPQLVTVHVKDENDQVPQFSHAIHRAQLSQGTRPGVPFLFLEASDGDAPGTANSDLRFHILSQSPPQPLPDMFQLDPHLGALALSPSGSTSLDHALEETYQLLVQVKDMGDQPSGHQAIATVEISIVENSWAPLEPVHLAENLKVAYPHSIAQVHWSGGDVHYQLESQPPGPFDVDTEGMLHVTMELDREAQAEYQLQVRAQNSHGEDYAEPLELQVVVMDENDNAPVCSPHDPTVNIPELSPPGTEVARLSAEDSDAPGSPNSHIVYQLLSPEPEEGAENKAFELDPTSGSVTLGTAPLHAGQNILLRVLAVDLAGSESGLSSTCEVTVMVTDVNNHAPEFINSQIGPVTLPEDVKPGALVATLMATDADLEPAFRLMDFAIEEGDPEGIFDLSWEPDSDHVQLRLRKNLSYETAPDHKVVVVVRNVEELVGPGPGPAATATVTILVERVVAPLKLDQESYETSIPVSTPAGSLLLTIQPSDPMSRTLRFSLVNDSEGWLCIKEVSGEVHTAQSLQGAQPGDTYTVLVEAQDTDKPGLSTSATVVLHFLKASPVPASTLAAGPSRHLCTPRQDYGVVVSGVSEDPDLANRNGPYSFALGPNPTVQRDWRLQPLNDSHAYLTLALHWVEPGEYMVPVVVHHDTHMWQLQVKVIVCRCNVEGQCMRKVGRMKGMPTKLSAVGVLLGTLAAIGFILILVFTHLALARKDLDQPADSVPLKAAV